MLHSNYELRLTPACLPTCCCLATLPLSDVIPTLFAHCCQATAWTSSAKYKYIYKYFFHSNSRGLAPERGLRPDKFINLALQGTNVLSDDTVKKNLTCWPSLMSTLSLKLSRPRYVGAQVSVYEYEFHNRIQGQILHRFAVPLE